MAGAARTLSIRHLASGGLVTNYYCTSRCAHCLYCCSPQWEKAYIEASTARQNLEKIKTLGCTAIHVGGGEGGSERPPRHQGPLPPASMSQASTACLS